MLASGRDTFARGDIKTAGSATIGVEMVVVLVKNVRRTGPPSSRTRSIGPPTWVMPDGMAPVTILLNALPFFDDTTNTTAVRHLLEVWPTLFALTPTSSDSVTYAPVSTPPGFNSSHLRQSVRF